MAREYMTKDEKLNRVCSDFSSLPDDKQDYVLGILQALVFANNAMAAAKEQIQEKTLVERGIS